MLTPYRRHSADCKHRDKGSGYTSCRCPIWTYGQTEDGRTVGQSLKTRDWKRAMTRLEQLAAAPVPMKMTAALPGDAVLIEKAIELYLADCRRRKLRGSTIA